MPKLWFRGPKPDAEKEALIEQLTFAIVDTHSHGAVHGMAKDTNLAKDKRNIAAMDAALKYIVGKKNA